MSNENRGGRSERQGIFCHIFTCRWSKSEEPGSCERMRECIRDKTKNLSRKNLMELPTSVPRRVCHLDVSHNHISDWKHVQKLKHVRTFNVTDNGLKRIPDEFQGSLPHLSELNISGNKLETFPCLYWDDIKSLDVSKNKVESISAEALKTATSLETVNIKCNEVSSLPESLGQLTSLKELCLDYNKLQRLPCSGEEEEEEEEEEENVDAECETKTVDKKKKKKHECWAKLKCLQTLKVAYNKLKSIPGKIARARALTHLDASGNLLETIPGCLGRLPNLRELRFQQNKLIRIPKDLFRAGNKIRVLHLNNNQLTTLPTSIKHLIHAEDVRLANNELEEIPEELGLCVKIVRLDLNHNKLKSLPKTLGKLIEMTRLNVSHNDIADRLPKSLENCSKLQELLASNNPRLRHILDTYQFLTKLEWLDVSCCSIVSLDPSIGTLGAMSVLRLNDNKLTSITPAIGKLDRNNTMIRMDLNGNDMESIPSSILSMISNSNKISETAIPVAQEIVPGLLLGGIHAARNRKYLDKACVTHVLNLAGSGNDQLNENGLKEIEANKLFPEDYIYLDVDVGDTRTASILPYFDRCNLFINRALSQRGVVLCHCWRGVSRSAAICIAYIMAKDNISYEKALATVKSKRKCVRCNSAFVKQLKEYELILAKRNKK